MSDRELLALAAKALGDPKIVWNGGIWADNGRLQTADARGDRYPCIWNPLTDDGDALRLAIDLQIQFGVVLEYSKGWAESRKTYIEFMYAPSQRYSATRRAIVRVAAEIGKTMP